MAACVNTDRTVQEKADGSHAWIHCTEVQARQESVNLLTEVGLFVLAFFALAAAVGLLARVK